MYADVYEIDPPPQDVDKFGRAKRVEEKSDKRHRDRG